MDELLQAFVLGNAAILTNACMLPLYPGLLAFLAGNANNERARRGTAILGVLVLAGILTMMILIGGLLYLLQATFANVLPVILPLIYLIVIGFGLMMLTGRNPFARLASTEAPVLRNPYLTAYVYGLFFGPMTLPCTGPVITTAFLLGTQAGGSLGGELLYVLAFGLGFGWPLVLLPLLAAPFQRRLLGWLTEHYTALTRASGVLLIAIGLFGILTELLPQVAPEFVLGQSAQLLYWGLALLLTVGVGWWTINSSEKAKREPISEATA